jgi:hypothetical protein
MILYIVIHNQVIMNGFNLIVKIISTDDTKQTEYSFEKGFHN